jgi:hypothetical protein
VGWGEKHTSQYVEQNNEITSEIIGFHNDPRGLFKQKSELLPNGIFRPSLFTAGVKSLRRCTALRASLRRKEEFVRALDGPTEVGP